VIVADVSVPPGEAPGSVAPVGDVLEEALKYRLDRAAFHLCDCCRLVLVRRAPHLPSLELVLKRFLCVCKEKEQLSSSRY